MNNNNLDNDFEQLQKKSQAELDSIEVPASLQPNAIEQLLMSNPPGDEIKEKRILDDAQKATHGKDARTKLIYRTTGIVAACAALLVTGTAFFSLQLQHQQNVKQQTAESSFDTAGNTDTETGSHWTNRDMNFGDLFKQATSMQEIASVVRHVEREQSHSGWGWGTDDVLVYESGEIGKEEAASDLNTNSGMSAMDYSTTNLQVDGVDEGDVIKTDGSYIYSILDEYELQIVKADQGQLSEAATISASDFDNMFFEELYLDVDDHMLTVIGTTGHSNYYMDDMEDIVYDFCYINYRVQTHVLTYDVSDPSQPQLVDEFVQDGNYQSSRMVDNYLYLFTYVYDFHSEDNRDIVLPLVGDERLCYNDVYLCCVPEVNSQMILTAVESTADGQMERSDSLSMMMPNGQVYVSTENIYVYYTDYNYTSYNDGMIAYAESNGMTTQIAKLGYNDGTFSTEATLSAEGQLNDTFAISEHDGFLYLLLQTGWTGDSNSSNNLHIYDSALNEAGSITNIAPGEYIYAARYLGSMAYFITYQSIDPLFVADLSDPYNPQLLGNVEISGFSEYLHPFGENRLLGIGYETKPNDWGGITTECIKLVMFDTTDPLNPQVLDSVLLEDVQYSQACYNYKAVLVNPNSGLIGLPGESWDSYGSSSMFYCYEWDGSQFVHRLDADYCGELGIYYAFGVRGSYIDNYLYISADAGFVSYDMDNDYSIVDSLKTY